RSREGWCLLAMGLATTTHSIVPVLPALKIFHYRGRIPGIKISCRPSLRRSDKNVPRHRGILEALAHDTSRALCARLKRAIRGSAPGWEYLLFSHSDQVVRKLKIRDSPVHSRTQNEKGLRWEGCVVSNTNVSQCRHRRTHLRKRAKPTVILTANVVEYIVVNAVTLSTARGTARIRQSRAHLHPARHMTDAVETNHHIRGLADGAVVLLVLDVPRCDGRAASPKNQAFPGCFQKIVDDLIRPSVVATGAARYGLRIHATPRDGHTMKVIEVGIHYCHELAAAQCDAPRG